jgi:hypothetical protein
MADMSIGERELAVVLQAAVDHARQRLFEQGGFLPFGGRAKPDGEIEFVEFSGTGGQPLAALRQELVEILGTDAKSGSLVAAAFVADTALPENDEFSTAIAVQVESPGFCRLIVVPYRRADEEIELGAMIPQEAKPLVYT